jgi:PadR family transcriptional regulator, regulatory protein PadR
MILRTLSPGPPHGYAIARRIKAASKEGLEIEEGSLYPALNRMLVKGRLAAEWGISENNRKARFHGLTTDDRPSENATNSPEAPICSRFTV